MKSNKNSLIFLISSLFALFCLFVVVVGKGTFVAVVVFLLRFLFCFFLFFVCFFLFCVFFFLLLFLVVEIQRQKLNQNRSTIARVDNEPDYSSRHD